MTRMRRKLIVLLVVEVAALAAGLFLLFRPRVDPVLAELKVDDFDRIELGGPCLSKFANNGMDLTGDQVIRDRKEITEVLVVLTLSQPYSKRMREETLDFSSDFIRIFTKKRLDMPTWGVRVHVDHVEEDFGKEMKRLYEKYRRLPDGWYMRQNEPPG